MSIQRYDEELHGFVKSNMVTDAFGMWVTFDDHAALLAAKDAEIAALEAGSQYTDLLANLEGSLDVTLFANDEPCSESLAHHVIKVAFDKALASARREALEEAAKHFEDAAALASGKNYDTARSIFLFIAAEIRALIAAPATKPAEEASDA